VDRWIQWIEVRSFAEKIVLFNQETRRVSLRSRVGAGIKGAASRDKMSD
jgi:hypothetical protein